MSASISKKNISTELTVCHEQKLTLARIAHGTQALLHALSTQNSSLRHHSTTGQLPSFPQASCFAREAAGPRAEYFTAKPALPSAPRCEAGRPARLGPRARPFRWPPASLVLRGKHTRGLTMQPSNTQRVGAVASRVETGRGGGRGGCDEKRMKTCR